MQSAAASRGWTSIARSSTQDFTFGSIAGIRDAGSLVLLLELDHCSSTIIAGLETVKGPRELTEIVKEAGSGRVVFSLDLFDGSPRIAGAGSLGDRGPP